MGGSGDESRLGGSVFRTRRRWIELAIVTGASGLGASAALAQEIRKNDRKVRTVEDRGNCDMHLLSI